MEFISKGDKGYYYKNPLIYMTVIQQKIHIEAV